MADFGGAYACSRAPDVSEPTQEELFSAASAVFVAHLTKTEEVKPADPSKDAEGVIEGTFRVIEILKGQPPADGKVKSELFFPGNCTIPLISGMDYIFFIDNRFLDKKENYIWWPSGSANIMNINGSQVQQMLTKLRALPK
jgi:hypothetical protein